MVAQVSGEGLAVSEDGPQGCRRSWNTKTQTAVRKTTPKEMIREKSWMNGIRGIQTVMEPIKDYPPLRRSSLMATTMSQVNTSLPAWLGAGGGSPLCPYLTASLERLHIPATAQKGPSWTLASPGRSLAGSSPGLGAGREFLLIAGCKRFTCTGFAAMMSSTQRFPSLWAGLAVDMIKSAREEAGRSYPRPN